MVAQEYTPPLAAQSGTYAQSLISPGNYPADQVYVVSWIGNYQLGENAAVTVAFLGDSPEVRESVAWSEQIGTRIHRGAVAGLGTGATQWP